MQLFNAVRKHQKTIDKKVKEAGGSERKKAKLLSSVSKKDFIDVLRRTEGDARAPAKPEKNAVSSPSARSSSLHTESISTRSCLDPHLRPWSTHLL